MENGTMGMKNIDSGNGNEMTFPDARQEMKISQWIIFITAMGNESVEMKIFSIPRIHFLGPRVLFRQ